MATQTTNGKAFEYSLAFQYFNFLDKLTKTEIIENSSFFKAKSMFDSLKQEKKEDLNSAALKSVEFIVNIEPRIINSIDEKDILQIEIAGDKSGQKGDVRDVIFIRAKQKWEIGFSAKHNHKALKHSRLSHKLDFGLKWIGNPCSTSYWERILPIFDQLQTIRNINKTTRWSEAFDNKIIRVYKPILEAFKSEVQKMSKDDPQNFANKFVHYLIGYNDFYKIIKGKKKIEIHGFNINGTLNKNLGKIKTKDKVDIIKLPTRLIEIDFKPDSYTTLIATFNEGWQISFRIHSASSKVESSLKFDITLISTPNSLYKSDIFL